MRFLHVSSMWLRPSPYKGSKSRVWGACEVTLEGGGQDILLVAEVTSFTECMF